MRIEPWPPDFWTNVGDHQWPTYTGPSLQAHLDAILLETETKKQAGNFGDGAAYHYLRMALFDFVQTTPRPKEVKE